MRHKFEVVYHVGVPLCWVLLECLQFFLKQGEMNLELLLVQIRLAFDLVLQLSKSVSLLILVQVKLVAILSCHKIDHLTVSTTFPFRLDLILGRCRVFI